ncbi:TIGR00299 family protein [Desulfitobacterium dichloroeliminans LMG P-21439]|uniref:Pyridinium-3,5-bisthiocarboxylic acid mononucleotide nickel insertion protein n=1 Tax=Desulfitobacterium dichloroeliminans (strain LMG P-21439 / DCA1) TaxID=871963 RepID=L0F9M6_DESDL|nr:nickel pincer cofactor biosynthesis protein LarC [Desulfitobacterium dichloroeliminans]AGA69730.1 TIGR00299 family protein [Desulfitobacterium dichloroeliminans LMG P-21439]
MKVAYLDCFSGISGDMLLGALVDAGLDFKLLQRDLAGLGLDEYEIYEQKVIKQGISGTKVQVLSLEGHVHRHLRDIQDIIERSSLPNPVKDKSLTIFTRLGEAEAKIHGTTIDQIHFHEVGAVDAIVDIVGAVIGFWRLGIEKVFSSSVHVGKGFVKAAHGLLPVPAPATLELLRGVPIYSRDIEGELVTPTGAALLTAYCQDFGSIPLVKVDRIGYGAGEKDLTIPNLLRLTIGELEVSESEGYHGVKEGKAMTVEANIDDMNPEFYDYLYEKLFAAGAMDVYMQTLQMKKNRPAVMLTVQIPPYKLTAIRQILFTETTTLGLRVYPIKKYMLPYEFITLETKYGSAKAKIATFEEKICTVSPEYEDCRKLAQSSGEPLKHVYDEVKERAKQKINEVP